ncbi:MAG: HNH endonuclease [Candidatus Cloacimonetes bacterium]|nr:HNH endonuclease [Candidatus Cloacimonadota bacterium]
MSVAFEFNRRAHLLKVGMTTRFRRKRIKRQCDFCKEIYERIPSRLGKYCSYSCASKMLWQKRNHEDFSGTSNWNWRGGSSGETRLRTNRVAWRELADYIRTRDEYKCAGCGISGKLYVHHIIPYRISRDDREENLITLCASCHSIQEASLRRQEQNGELEVS